MQINTLEKAVKGKGQDAGRSHAICRARNEKSQAIVRFISYRTRLLIYSIRKTLKGSAEEIFITEYLTEYRTTLVRRL